MKIPRRSFLKLLPAIPLAAKVLDVVAAPTVPRLVPDQLSNPEFQRRMSANEYMMRFDGTLFYLDSCSFNIPVSNVQIGKVRTPNFLFDRQIAFSVVGSPWSVKNVQSAVLLADGSNRSTVEVFETASNRLRKLFDFKNAFLKSVDSEFSGRVLFDGSPEAVRVTVVLGFDHYISYVPA